MGEIVDICVVGAGPAGLSFALSFPEKNKILVLEKEYFPRDKVFGGGFLLVRRRDFLYFFDLCSKYVPVGLVTHRI
jgi:flavin-dependent dehydrogenase